LLTFLVRVLFCRYRGINSLEERLEDTVLKMEGMMLSEWDTFGRNPSRESIAILSEKPKV